MCRMFMWCQRVFFFFASTCAARQQQAETHRRTDYRPKTGLIRANWQPELWVLVLICSKSTFFGKKRKRARKKMLVALRQQIQISGVEGRACGRSYWGWGGMKDCWEGYGEGLIYVYIYIYLNRLKPVRQTPPPRGLLCFLNQNNF